MSPQRQFSIDLQQAVVCCTSLLLIFAITATSMSEELATASQYFDETKATTLFAFDDISIPFSQNLKLKMRMPERHPANPVVQRGAAGTVDAWAVQFYGSIIREGEKFRMWYVSCGNDRFDKDSPRSSPWRVAYAESDDGICWTKPHLGLVEYNGSRDNNLVRMEPRLGTVNVKVLFDPDDPDPNRRYKMGAHVWFPKNDVRLGTLAPYVSKDGLDWKLAIDAKAVDFEMSPSDLVVPRLHLEPVGGLYKWNGLFYASGQNAIQASRPYHGRVTRAILSRDFAHWSHVSTIAFVRDPQHKLLGPGRSREGEQTHEGISVWNRGNVLVGVSGMWHGAAEWDGVTIDLGFAISNDGVRFREPAREHIFLKRGNDGDWDQGGLLQGQGFLNIGEQTYIYYGAWDPRRWRKSPPRGGVGIALLPRDRFADLVVDETTKGTGDYQLPETVSEFMTKPIHVSEAGSRFYVNADGLSAKAKLQVELLSQDLKPLPRFSGENATTVERSGFQTPIIWGDQEQVTGLPKQVRLKVTFVGANKTDIRFSAFYAR